MSLRWINSHAALRVAGSTLADVFGIVYFYGLGLALPQIFLIYGGIQLLRFAVRPFIVRLAASAGLKRSLVIGTLLYAGSYIVLGQVHGISWWLAIFILWSAVADAVYWTSYHAYFALLSTKEKRGEDIGAKEAVLTLARALAPVASGVAILNFGFSASFALASLLVIISAIPLLFLPATGGMPVVSLREAWSGSDKRGFLAHFGHGWHEAGLTVWSLIVFLLVKDYAIAGGLASLIVIFQMIAFLVVGKFIDRGHGYAVAHVALGLLAVVALARLGLVRDIPTIIAFDIVYAVASCLYGPALDTILYNCTASAKSPWGFQLISESSVDVGYTLSWIFGAVVTALGASLYWMLAWSVGGLLVMLFVFRNYYGERT